MNALVSPGTAPSTLAQAAAMPVTWVALRQELQQDRERTDTAEGVFRIGREHGGSWGPGIASHAAISAARTAERRTS